VSERRTTGTEVRAEGRRLSGTVLTFGEVSPSHREKFARGSIRLAPSVHLDLYHDRERAVAWAPGGGLKLAIGARSVDMTAELPPIPAADRALAEVRSRRTTGLSIEFRALEDRDEHGIRVVTSAELSGVGLVRSPSYLGSRVEARQRSGRTMTATIPEGRKLDCECGPGGAQFASFDEGVAELMLDAAFELERQLIAVYGDYKSVLASTARGTVRRAGSTGFAIDIPDSAAGRAVLDAHQDAGVVVRPFPRAGSAQGEVVGDTVVYHEPPELRALIVSPTDRRGGWPEPKITAGPVDEPRGALLLPRRPEQFLWL